VHIFVPKHFPVCIQPLAGELLSSWLLRVAAANATTLEEVLAAVSCADSSFSNGNMGLIINSPKKYGTACLCSAEFRRPKSPI
jgi:hypothetical protein